MALDKVTILNFGNLSVFVVCWICLVWTPIGHTYAYNSPKVNLKSFKIKCLPLTPIEWQDLDVDAIWKPRFGSLTPFESQDLDVLPSFERQVLEALPRSECRVLRDFNIFLLIWRWKRPQIKFWLIFSWFLCKTL